MRRPANTVTVTDDELLVVPRGLAKVWGFRRSIRVPLAHVRGATVDDGAADAARGLRAPGLAVPGRTVGTFHRDGERTYFNVRGHGDALVVQLREEELARLVLTVPDPAALEHRINAAVRTRRR